MTAVPSVELYTTKFVGAVSLNEGHGSSLPFQETSLERMVSYSRIRSFIFLHCAQLRQKISLEVFSVVHIQESIGAAEIDLYSTAPSLLFLAKVRTIYFRYSSILDFGKHAPVRICAWSACL